MAQPVASHNLDLTLQGLFPGMTDAAKNPKCVTIGKALGEMAKVCDMSSFTQVQLQENAAKRLAYLSRDVKLTLPQADHAAFTMYQQNGVSAQTAQEYFSHLLTSEDAKKWQIHLI